MQRKEGALFCKIYSSRRNQNYEKLVEKREKSIFYFLKSTFYFLMQSKIFFTHHVIYRTPTTFKFERQNIILDTKMFSLKLKTYIEFQS